MPSGGGECRAPWDWGVAMPGRKKCPPLISLAKVGRKKAGPGQPLPLWQGVDDAGGWVPRTQNKPVFYFQVLLWILSKVPGEREGQGRGQSSSGEDCWERVGVDGGLTGQKGRALIRISSSEALGRSWAPPASIGSPTGAPLAAKPPTFKLPSPQPVRIIFTEKDNKGIGCLKTCCQAVPGISPPLARYWEEAGYHPTG